MRPALLAYPQVVVRMQLGVPSLGRYQKRYPYLGSPPFCNLVASTWAVRLRLPACEVAVRREGRPVARKSYRPSTRPTLGRARTGPTMRLTDHPNDLLQVHRAFRAVHRAVTGHLQHGDEVQDALSVLGVFRDRHDLALLGLDD